VLVRAIINHSSHRPKNQSLLSLNSERGWMERCSQLQLPRVARRVGEDRRTKRACSQDLALAWSEGSGPQKATTGRTPLSAEQGRRCGRVDWWPYDLKLSPAWLHVVGRSEQTLPATNTLGAAPGRNVVQTVTVIRGSRVVISGELNRREGQNLSMRVRIFP
jgi:hypothetical protein